MRINEKIKAREVRLILDTGEQAGVVPLNQALTIAKERNLDLVEVAPTAVPPVCRLLEYGKFRYEQTKKEREARKHQKVVLLKEVRFTPKIDEHDLAFKTRTIQKFLEAGDKVKVTVRFKGRELAHPQLGKQVLDEVANRLKGTGTAERTPLMEGRNMTMIMAPLAQKAEKQQKVETAVEAGAKQS